MQLKKMFRWMWITGGILALSACSAPGHNKKDSNTGVYDANSTAQASGIGEGAGFGDQNENATQSLSKRTYYFDFAKSEIREQDKPAILANANYLVTHTNAKITLEGHTDPRGSREYNVALGEHRANAVADFMKAKGVSSDQIQVVSYGAERLAAAGRSEQDYQLDRRVVLLYSRE
jgi:peptidoglycan-associated lipoprotein